MSFIAESNRNRRTPGTEIVDVDLGSAFFSDCDGQAQTIEREPLGVVANISAWNLRFEAHAGRLMHVRTAEDVRRAQAEVRRESCLAPRTARRSRMT